MATVKISATLPVEIEITEREIGLAILQHLSNVLGINDDAGCDWLTDELGKFACIDSPEWIISIHPNDIALVNAANILRCGMPLTIKQEG